MAESVLVLGGGMAGLTAAGRLADAGRRVTVVQRGWRLGGKGASHRSNGRIEEHGLHVWLGYYDNAFNVVGATGVFGDHRSTIDRLFMPADRIGLADGDSTWLARFAGNERIPGAKSDVAPTSTATDLARQAASLLIDLVRSTSIASSFDGADDRGGRVRLSGSPSRASRTPGQLGRLAGLFDSATAVGVAQALRVATLVGERSGDPLMRGAVETLRELREAVGSQSRGRSASRLGEVADLVITVLVGIATDGLTSHPDGFAAIDHLDFRDWLARHGAAPETLNGAILRGMYDLVFAYRRGDHDAPAFAAGTGLMLAGRFFFDYKGSLFWKMRAGMGETVFAPMYQSLVDRGVEFRFFHRLHNLHLDDAGAAITSVELARQVRLAPGVREYRPLVADKDMAVFPGAPLTEQLADETIPHDLESHDSTRESEEMVELRRGADFDSVVLATSIGMLPHVCGELIERDQRWRTMVETVSTVPTQSLQLWLRPDERELGVVHTGATAAGYEPPFDTYASMTHLIDVETPAEHDPTGAIGYFCSALDERQCARPEQSDSVVRRNAEVFMNERLHRHWPRSVDADGFRWDLLVGAPQGADAGALDSQYLRANVDPSDRYVQSLPGSGGARLRADDSGVDNLFLAGDWIDSGLNAGCLEAATISGLQAANAVLGRDLCEGVSGGWTPVGERSSTRHRSDVKREQ